MGDRSSPRATGVRLAMRKKGNLGNSLEDRSTISKDKWTDKWVAENGLSEELLR